MELSGNLKDFGLASLLQFISYSGQTGMLEISKGVEKGFVYVDKGKITHCEFKEQKGEEALYLLFALTDATFEFHLLKTSEATTIDKITEVLLLEGTRKVHEMSVFEQKISDPLIVRIAINPAVDKNEIHLTSMDWSILSFIDSKRSVQEIIKDAGKSKFDVYKTLYGLLLTGLIEEAGYSVKEKGILDGIFSKSKASDALTVLNPFAKPVKIERELALKIYERIDGKKTIKEIAQELNISFDDAEKEIKHLIELKKIIQIK